MRESPSKNPGAVLGEHAAVAWLRRWGWAPALGGALIATLGDLGQLWVVNAARPALLPTAPPSGIIVAATLAGVLGIPFYGLGYYVRAHRARLLAPKRAALVASAGAAVAVLGAAVHAVTGVAVSGNVGGMAGGLAPLEGIFASGPIVLTLWGLATLAFLCAGVGEACLPQARALRACNPLVVTVVLSVAAAALPAPWPDFVAPAALNIAHLVFFARLGAAQ